ncbi:zinc finger protein 845 [Plutella xylostella]|nr:zinc finger protein 845 [Plutella xylostella]
MLVLNACTVCLSTAVKLFHLDCGNLRKEYNLVSGLKTTASNGLPSYLCVECAAYVRKCKRFRDKCQRANYTLNEILHKNKEITECNIGAINRKSINLLPEVSYLDRSRASYQICKFQWTKLNRPSEPVRLSIPVIHYGDTPSDPPTENTQQTVEIEVPLKKKRISKPNNNAVKEEIDQIQSCYVSFEPIDYDKKEELLNDSATVGADDEYFNDYTDDMDFEVFQCKTEAGNDDKNVDGSNLEEEYASMIPISAKEARAAVEVYNMFSTGKNKCTVCGKGYKTVKRLKVHMRMHDKHVSGVHYCELCGYYYKTEFLLKTHMTEKHLYKYVCRQCPEVNFDRTSAKQHFIWTHLQKGHKKNANWYESRPTWLSSRGGRRVKGVATLRPVRKASKLPADFLKYSTVTPQEQYQMISDRKKSKNYLESEFKCEMCFKGFREMDTYGKHMRKHDPAFAGPLQCDICKLHFKSTRYMYKHMIISHLFRYSCQMCEYTCYNKGQAQEHYRFHKNVTYKCNQCDLVFKKHSTRLTHIRIKHPSTALCNLCGHSFVSDAGLYFHKRKAHSAQEIQSASHVATVTSSPLYCAACDVMFLSEAAFATHFGSSSNHAATNLSIQTKMGDPKRRGRGEGRARKARGANAASEILNNGLATGTNCEVCGIQLANDVQARAHYRAAHPGTAFLKRYMCHVCGHTTKQYANLQVHMRTHTREKPYPCPHCDRRFSMPSNRDRHIVVHTGEKPYECEHCHRRFTQSSAVKLHIQTVHLKIPYAPWDKKNRKRRKEMEATVVQTQPKLMVDSTGEYINAYITYNDV